MDLAPPFRRASPDDAIALAELANMAGEGLPLYLWERMAAAGEDPWSVGRDRARRETGSFSWRNAIVVEAANEVAGCLIGYPIGDTPQPTDGLPAMFVPMQELENTASGTWYVNILAIRPSFRGSGLGGALLSLAGRLAAEAGCRGLSVIVSDANAAALRLYERCGYRSLAERPMVKEDWRNPGRTWVLLVKPG